jgi:hypothetical protein
VKHIPYSEIPRPECDRIYNEVLQFDPEYVALMEEWGKAADKFWATQREVLDRAYLRHLAKNRLRLVDRDQNGFSRTKGRRRRVPRLVAQPV